MFPVISPTQAFVSEITDSSSGMETLRRKLGPEFEQLQHHELKEHHQLGDGKETSSKIFKRSDEFLDCSDETIEIDNLITDGSNETVPRNSPVKVSACDKVIVSTSKKIHKSRRSSIGKNKLDPKVLMDVASVKAINQIMTKEIATFKENRKTNQSHNDLTLEWSKTWEKATKLQKKKRKKAITVEERKRRQCTKRIKRKRTRFYRNFHDYSGNRKPISDRQWKDPELRGDVMYQDEDEFINNFDVNQFL